MSSFAGHALAPVILYAATEPGPVPRRALWPLALVAMAWAPDIDYLLRSLILPGDPPIRVTLLWPFSRWTARLAGGILPSAGRLSIDNPYLYRNLLLEIGVLLPVLGIVILLRAESASRARRWIAIGGLGVVSICFMLLSASLPR